MINEKRFEETFNLVYSNYFKELNTIKQSLIQERKHSNSEIVLAIVLFNIALITAVVIGIISDSGIVFFIALFICLLLYAIFLNSRPKKQHVDINEYSNNYRSVMMANIGKMSIPDIIFDPHKSMPKEKYEESHFENFDQYFSKGIIYGKINGYEFKASTIKAGLSGDNHETDYFEGLFGYVPLKNIDDFELYLESDPIWLHIPSANADYYFDKNDFHLINSEETTIDNKVEMAKAILRDFFKATEEIRDEYKISMTNSFIIRDNTLFIRVYNYKPFMPDIASNNQAFNKEQLFYEYKTFDLMSTTIERLITIINKSKN